MNANARVGRWIAAALVGVIVAMRAVEPAAAGEKKGALVAKLSRLAAPFDEEDIDWESTTELPANDDVKGFAESREDQILRCIGLVSPGAPHGQWLAAAAAEGSAGTERHPGYCRLAFKKRVTLGAVIVGSAAPPWGQRFDTFGNAAVAVLKPDAPFPGDVENDDHWQPLERLQPLGAAAVFVPPSWVKVRAVRMNSPVEAIRFFAKRFGDPAGAAQFTDGRNPEKPLGKGGWLIKVDGPIGGENSQSLTCAWDSPHKISGLMLLQPCFAACRLQVYRGPAGQAAISTREDDWRTVAVREYAAAWRGFQNDVVEFDKETRTTAVRVVVTEPWLAPNDDITVFLGGQGHAWGLTGLVALEGL